jgi:hypothetical protein
VPALFGYTPIKLGFIIAYFSELHPSENPVTIMCPK